MMIEISFFVAFLAGFISFLSPCVLPLVPVYISFISGLTIEQMGEEEWNLKTFVAVTSNCFLFILGFSFIFILLGASVTLAGQFIQSQLPFFSKIAGLVIIILGLHIAGLFKIGFLNYEKKFHLRNKPLGYLGSFLVGIAFAFGWTPCIGPILGTILAYASTEESLSKGIYLLTIYSVGLAIPFFVTGIATNLLLKMLHKIRKFWGKIEAACGILLIIMGILLLTNKFQSIAFLFL